MTAILAEYSQKSTWSQRRLYGGLRWCLRAVKADPLLLGLIPGLRRAQPRTVTVSDVDFALVLAQADPLADFALILARHCGLRAATILRLAPKHVKNNHITVPTKGSTWTNVPMSPAVGELLAGLVGLCVRPDQPILAQFGVKHGFQLNRRIAKAQAAAGCKGCWGLHDLRRTFARALYRESGDVRVVQNAMAHASPVHTFHYLVSPDTQPTIAQLEAAEPKGGVE